MAHYRPIRDELMHIGHLLAAGWRRLLCSTANARRWIFRGHLPDYVVFVLDGEIAERSPDEPRWYSLIPGRKPPLTIEYLSNALRRIAGDPAIAGVVLLVKTSSLSLSQAQNLSMLFDRFRDWCQAHGNGAAAKQIIVHMEQISAPNYVMACGADEIYVTPLTDWSVLGLHVEPVYLKETLARVGIEFEVAKIAPWKTAYDRFSRTTMSAEEQEQTDRLLDGIYDDILTAISNGRGLSRICVEELVNQAPLTANCARTAKLIDGIAYEDELPARLGELPRAVALKPFTKIARLLKRHVRKPVRGSVGVLSMQGAIMPGSSRSFPVPLPLLGDNTIGSATAQQAVRAARENDSLAAVVLHVDSPGGSALASDIIWRELSLLAQEKPLIVYMGNVAASGGYYIATPGHSIVAQRATMTGSIGVISAKPVTSETYTKLGARRHSIDRGDNANLYSDAAPWTPAQQDKMMEGIHHVYQEFKERVAAGRDLEYAGLDAICNGRVWTGAQAKEHGLVDELGDFQTAVDAACHLADLPTDGTVRTVTVSAPKERQMAKAVATSEDVAQLKSWHELGALAAAAIRGDWSHLLQREHYWLLADGLPKIKG